MAVIGGRRATREDPGEKGILVPRCIPPVLVAPSLTYAGCALLATLRAGRLDSPQLTPDSRKGPKRHIRIFHIRACVESGGPNPEEQMKGPADRRGSAAAHRERRKGQITPTPVSEPFTVTLPHSADGERRPTSRHSSPTPPPHPRASGFDLQAFQMSNAASARAARWLRKQQRCCRRARCPFPPYATVAR